MSSTSLARAHPDHAHIAAISAALALNLGVILIASRPITPARFPVVNVLTPLQLIRFIDPPAVLPPPPIELKPLPHPPAPVAFHTLPSPVAAAIVAPGSEGQLATLAISVPTLAPIDTNPDTSTAAPIEASLAYRSAALNFPVQALRQHMHGVVLLRVLVDETGKPLDVVVEHGSGYALLDRSAREQVLAAWRFQPAMLGGRAVRAWAWVPVSFKLRELD
jgi:protein TonB